MGKPGYPILVAALASALALPPLAASAQQPLDQHHHERKPPQRPQFSGPQPGPAHLLSQGRRHFNPPPGGPSPPAARYRSMPAKDLGGQVYHGHLAWEHGRWRHEMRNGRYGWWWDVGGAWYFYPQPIVGPPPYVSEFEVVIPDGPDSSLVEGDYPPPDETSYPAPPPDGNTYSPPPPDQETVGDAIASGADIDAEAEQRHGYYWWRGDCYYRYPSGAYVPVDPRYCY
jgi:hypothetical protein